MSLSKKKQCKHKSHKSIDKAAKSSDTNKKDIAEKTPASNKKGRRGANTSERHRSGPESAIEQYDHHDDESQHDNDVREDVQENVQQQQHQRSNNQGPLPQTPREQRSVSREDDEDMTNETPTPAPRSAARNLRSVPRRYYNSDFPSVPNQVFIIMHDKAKPNEPPKKLFLRHRNLLRVLYIIHGKEASMTSMQPGAKENAIISLARNKQLVLLRPAVSKPMNRARIVLEVESLKTSKAPFKKSKQINRLISDVNEEAQASQATLESLEQELSKSMHVVEYFTLIETMDQDFEQCKKDLIKAIASLDKRSQIIAKHIGKSNVQQQQEAQQPQAQQSNDTQPQQHDDIRLHSDSS
ncbi:hypothetical protein KEM55_002300 [Ascosphaera atra]|nr:hypothetical protein KEM55_002300 [Ascosphaera atra]